MMSVMLLTQDHDENQDQGGAVRLCPPEQEEEEEQEGRGA